MAKEYVEVRPTTLVVVRLEGVTAQRIEHADRSVAGTRAGAEQANTLIHPRPEENTRRLL
jgi:hypothetical protein